jgi:PEP-CTERM motif
MLRRSFLAGFAVLVLAAAANAGQMYVVAVIDPTTTAGAGIAGIARANSSGTFTVTSTASGVGKWQLYALDDVTGSFGLAGFSIPIGGTATGHLNRSPTATFAGYNDADETDSNQSGAGGYSDSLVRSGVGSNPANPIQGSQAIGSQFDIPGMGQTASNLNLTPNLIAPGDHRTWGAVTSGQWGNYASSPTIAQLAGQLGNVPALQGAIDAMNAGKKWVFLGEGSYTDAAAFKQSALGPLTAINYYNTNAGGQLGFLPLAGSSITQAVVGVPEPATLSLIGLAVVGFLGFRRRQA